MPPRPPDQLRRRRRRGPIPDLQRRRYGPRADTGGRRRCQRPRLTVTAARRRLPARPALAAAPWGVHRSPGYAYMMATPSRTGRPRRAAVRVAICVAVGCTPGALTALAVPPAWPRWTPARRNQDGAWGHMAPALRQARRARRRARQHSLGTCGARGSATRSDIGSLTKGTGGPEPLAPGDTRVWASMRTAGAGLIGRSRRTT